LTARTAGSSHPVAEQAALAALASGGGAIDGLIAGFFAAAGSCAGTLLSPVGVIVGGVGVGARVFDGRALQPGRGRGRPRGWQRESEVPEAARAAVPRSIAALSLVHAYGATQPWSTLARHGVGEAKKCGAKKRAELLLAVSRGGPTAMRAGSVMRSLEQAAGPTAGGVLSAADVLEALPTDEPPLIVSLPDSLEVGLAPWAPFAGNATFEGARSQVIVCADSRGVVGGLAFIDDSEGIELPGLELRLPRGGEPVRRGVTRVKPGQPRPAPLALALMRRQADSWFASVAVGGRGPIATDELSPGTLSEQLSQLCQPGGVALAASVQRRRTQLTRAQG